MPALWPLIRIVFPVTVARSTRSPALLSLAAIPVSRVSIVLPAIVVFRQVVYDQQRARFGAPQYGLNTDQILTPLSTRRMARPLTTLSARTTWVGIEPPSVWSQYGPMRMPFLKPSSVSPRKRLLLEAIWRAHSHQVDLFFVRRVTPKPSIVTPPPVSGGRSPASVIVLPRSA